MDFFACLHYNHFMKNGQYEFFRIFGRTAPLIAPLVQISVQSGVLIGVLFSKLQYIVVGKSKYTTGGVF